jgi:archaellum biogenesis ATPase FlaH
MLDETGIAETDSEGTISEVAPLRRAYDRIISGMSGGRPQMVFDEFWREGELALLFGEAGAGKSLLAMQLARTLAAGGDIPWFAMECSAGKTLYVDLSMSDRQFASRNSYLGKKGDERALPVSKRLYCDRPEDEGELIEWLERQIEAQKLKYVIIDDLSSIMRTCDGTRETVAVMRGLRRICGRFGVSILVVMQSEAPRSNARVSERDLGRQRSLCRLADSVFAIGRHPSRSGCVSLAQTRSRSSSVKWTVHNSIPAKVEESCGIALLRFEMDVSEEERELINSVKDLRRDGLSFREISIKLKISKSRAHRLDHRWYQMLEGDIAARIENENDEDEWDDEEDEAKGQQYLEQIGEPDRTVERSQVPEPRPRTVVIGPWQGPEPCPFMYDKSDAARRWLEFLATRHPEKEYTDVRRAYIAGDEWARPPGSRPPIDPDDPFAGMEVDADVRGNIKYVVERDTNDKPSLWYAYKPDGRLDRFVMTATGARREPANANLFGKFADIGKEREAEPDPGAVESIGT